MSTGQINDILAEQITKKNLDLSLITSLQSQIKEFEKELVIKNDQEKLKIEIKINLKNENKFDDDEIYYSAEEEQELISQVEICQR